MRKLLPWQISLIDTFKTARRLIFFSWRQKEKLIFTTATPLHPKK